MSYKNEWFLLEADDDIDEIEHREPTEEFLFYRAVAAGDVDKVKQNCEQGRFVEGEGVVFGGGDGLDNNVVGSRFQIKKGFLTVGAFVYPESFRPQALCRNCS